MSVKSREILRVIRESPGHMTAEEIYLAAKEKSVSVSMATVYRVLGILVDEGEIRKISIVGEPERYDKTLAPHEHLICCRCKAVQDVHAEDVQALLEEAFGITLESYDLSLRVVCKECKAKE